MYQLLIDELVDYFRDHLEDLNGVAFLDIDILGVRMLHCRRDVAERRASWSATHPVWGAPAMAQAHTAVADALTEATKETPETWLFFTQALWQALEGLGWSNAGYVPAPEEYVRDDDA